MKKLLAAMIVAAMFLTGISTVTAAGEVSYNTAKLMTGIIQLAYQADSGSRLKVMVEKDGRKVTYNLKNDGTAESFPLQLGNGEYNVSILENISGDKYRYIRNERINMILDDENQVYLGSVQNINWDYSMAAIAKAKELTKGMNSDSKKIKVIYDYLTNNLQYDYDKLSRLGSDYLPNIDNTIQTGKGICYDYASLFAAMLRSQGIPAKLVKGYSTNVSGYHAWNEVYNSSTGKWIIVDTTYDSQMKAAKVKYSMEKNEGEYKKVYEY